MASYETLRKLAAHPEWLAPRSDVRVFLGEPGAPDANKTVVEPGNAFSPGLRTFGVAWWLRLPQRGLFFAPESAPLETLRWRYEEGFLPLIHCDVDIGGILARHSLFQDGAAAERSEATCARLSLTNRGQQAEQVEIWIALRSLGPAGGPLSKLAVTTDGRGFSAGAGEPALLLFDSSPAAIGCGVGDPSPLAQDGEAAGAPQAEDKDGWCFGLARFAVTLAPGQEWRVAYDCPHLSYGPLRRELPSSVAPRPAQFAARAAQHLDGWRQRFAHLSVDVPDADFRNAFFAGLQHMLTAVVGDQARIAPLSYPLPWLRDSVYIIRCFDLAGLHDLARMTSQHCARYDFFGGFGAEGDGPGQGTWALAQHYRITGDKLWLSKVYPDIRRKCDWLFRMRRAKQPLRVQLDTPVFAWTQAERNSGVICLAARAGLIAGVMDHGVEHALGWVNHWALCGLREAAYTARELGFPMDAAVWDTEADELQIALEAHADRHPAFFAQERTTSSLLWPTRAWEETPQRVSAPFDAWWKARRGDGGDYRPEPYWLYFELAQAHNALLLGQPERAWQTLRYRLDHQDLPGLYGWREGGQGVGTDNAVHGPTLINQLRGCQRFESITPHGWTQAELWLLQRAMLVEEWRNGLLLFAGAPPEWLRPRASVSFGGLPTWYGVASARLQTVDGAAEATVSGLRPDVAVSLRLLGREVRGRSDASGKATLRLSLA